MHSSLLKILIVSFAFFLISLPVAAEPGSGPGFAAEQISFDKENGTVTAEGNVEINLPDRGISIKANRVVMGAKQIALPDGGEIEIPGGTVYVEGAKFVSDGEGFSFGGDFLK
jgi:lipopolysaccharide assembly outer membrane protein LptD (OstA)